MSGIEIHSTAIVSPKAELGAQVSIGPYAIIEADVRIGDECVIEAHAQILPGTRVDKACRIGRAAIIGGEPQSLAFDPRTPTFVEIGSGNIIREHVTIHRATVENAATRIGNENFLMVGCHLGHDVTIGDSNVIANGAMFGGHVELGNHSYLGGGAGFHQFVRVGDYCMVQGNSSISQDVPHYTTAAGQNALIGLNAIGLRRAGFDPAERKEIKRLYRMLFVANHNTQKGITEAGELTWCPSALGLLEFVRSATKRGLCTPLRSSVRPASGTVEVE